MFDKVDRSKTKKQGNVGLGQAIAYFTYIGATISIPLNDSQAYDILVDIDNHINRVQVKTVSKKATSGQYVVELRSTSFYTNKDFDNTTSELLFVLTELGDMYLFPTKEITTKTSITLNNTKEQFRVTINK